MIIRKAKKTQNREVKKMSEMDEEKTMEEQKKELIEIVSKIEDVNVLKEIYEELCKCMEEELEE